MKSSDWSGVPRLDPQGIFRITVGGYAYEGLMDEVVLTDGDSHIQIHAKWAVKRTSGGTEMAHGFLWSMASEVPFVIDQFANGAVMWEVVQIDGVGKVIVYGDENYINISPAPDGYPRSAKELLRVKNEGRKDV